MVFFSSLLLAAAACVSALPTRQLQPQALSHAGEQRDGALYHRRLEVGAAARDNSLLTVTIAGGGATNLTHSDALFGIPSYGGGLRARLYYPVKHDPTGCDAANLTADPDIPPQAIFLLERGGCSFSVKIGNAQRAGAIAAVVIDNLGLCGRSPECSRDACSRCPLYSTPTCQCVLPYLGDDGSGGAGISIPSMLITKEDGADLRTPAAVGKGFPPHALVSMRWDIPAPDDKVDWSLWHSPNDPLTYAFRKQLSPYLKYLIPSTHFTPRPYIFDGRAMGCAGPAPVFDCKDQCVNDGYYCAIDPDGDLDSGVTGADVVRESLRSACAFQQVVNDADGGLRWWAYTDAFQVDCGGSVAPGSPAPWSDECSYAAMKKSGLDPATAQVCVLTSNATVNPGAGDFTNVMLQGMVNARADQAIVTLPTVSVNDIILRGGVSPAAVLSAICAGYAAGTTPPVCACLSVSLDALGACVTSHSTGGSSTNTGASLPSWAGVLIAFAVIGTVIALGATLYNHRKQRRMEGELVDLMDDYRALAEETGSAAGDPAAAGAGTGVGSGPKRSRRQLSGSRPGSHEARSTGSGGPDWFRRALGSLVSPPAPGTAAGLQHQPATSASGPAFSGAGVV